jgi:arylsulfatase A-like enzyme
VVKVPLIIFKPGQTEREDIHTLTSCIDLLPTLLNFTGHQVPTNLPGQILPGFGSTPIDHPRTIYALDARLNSKGNQIIDSTIMMRRGNYKLIRYSGYADRYRFYNQSDKLKLMQIKDDVYYEIFNVENDPEDLINLAEKPSPQMKALIDELTSFFKENIEYPQ